jgi:hypothetical protein
MRLKSVEVVPKSERTHRKSKYDATLERFAKGKAKNAKIVFDHRDGLKSPSSAYTSLIVRRKALGLTKQVAVVKRDKDIYLVKR